LVQTITIRSEAHSVMQASTASSHIISIT
jgi:hypothetical protein